MKISALNSSPQTSLTSFKKNQKTPEEKMMRRGKYLGLGLAAVGGATISGIPRLIGLKLQEGYIDELQNVIDDSPTASSSFKKIFKNSGIEKYGYELVDKVNNNSVFNLEKIEVPKKLKASHVMGIRTLMSQHNPAMKLLALSGILLAGVNLTALLTKTHKPENGEKLSARKKVTNFVRKNAPILSFALAAPNFLMNLHYNNRLNNAVKGVLNREAMKGLVLPKAYHVVNSGLPLVTAPLAALALVKIKDGVVGYYNKKAQNKEVNKIDDFFNTPLKDFMKKRA